MPLGYDVTDEGRRLSISAYLFHGDLFNIDFKFGTHAVYSLWLKSIGFPSLLWSRLGFALLQAGIASLCYSIVRQVTSDRNAMLGSVIAGFTILVYVVQTVNYNNFPVFVLLTSALLITKAEQEDNVNFKHFLAGVVFMCAIVSRFPLALMLPLGLLYFFIDGFVHKNWLDALKKSLIYYSGVLIALALFLFFTYQIGDLDAYLEAINQKVIGQVTGDNAPEHLKTHFHDADSLLETYQRNLLDLLALTGWYLGVFLVVKIITVRTNAITTSIPTLAMLIFWFFMTSGRNWGESILSLSIVLFVANFQAIRKSKQLFPYIFWALCIAIFCFLGSNMGIRNIVMSGGISFLLSLCVALGFDIDSDSKKPSLAFYTSLAAALFLSLEVWHLKRGFIYRDAPEHELTAMFDSGPLLGILTQPERMKRVKELQAFFIENSGDPRYQNTLCANTIPMYYYELSIPPKTNFYWKMTTLSAEEKDAFFQSDDAPSSIIIALVNVRDVRWPVVDIPCHHSDQEYYDYYDQMLSDPSSPYELQFQNDAFGVYTLKKLN